MYRVEWAAQSRADGIICNQSCISSHYLQLNSAWSLKITLGIQLMRSKGLCIGFHKYRTQHLDLHHDSPADLASTGRMHIQQTGAC